MDKNFYNRSSADSLGWDPTWFGEKYFDEKLVRAIKKWQKAHGLAGDGLCGPMTYRHIWTERQSAIHEHTPDSPRYSEYIVYNGKFVPIKWHKVVLWSEEGGLAAKKGSYYDYTGRSKRSIRLFVNHWDVCLSSKSCQSVLDRRGISVHFLIDNDGTIYQTLDMQHGAWHAGSERVNRASVGVEISNAYYTKYQNWYEKNGFGPRPLVNDAWVHGNKLKEHLGFYPVQIEALKALWAAIHDGVEIPLQTVLGDHGGVSTRYEKDVKYGNFKGFISHYHVSKNKIDCAGLEIDQLLEDVEDRLHTGRPGFPGVCRDDS